MCCVVSCRAVALLLSRLADVPLFRLGLFWAPFSVYSGTSPTRLCVHCPWLRICGFCKIAPSRDLATPHMFVSYIVWLLAQTDMPVRWEDVHISSIGSTLLHTPLIYSYLLMLFSLDSGGRETVFENSKDPFSAPYSIVRFSILVAFTTKTVK